MSFKRGNILLLVANLCLCARFIGIPAREGILSSSSGNRASYEAKDKKTHFSLFPAIAERREIHITRERWLFNHTWFNIKQAARSGEEVSLVL